MPNFHKYKLDSYIYKYVRALNKRLLSYIYNPYRYILNKYIYSVQNRQKNRQGQ